VPVNEQNSTPASTPQPAPVTPPPTPEQPAEQVPTGHRIKSTISTVAILLLAPLIAILLTAYVFQSYQVDGPSMQETLHPEGFQPDATLPYGKNGAIPPTNNNVDVTLTATQIFVCGDNRSDSLDSRIFGPVETKQVIGKLVARIYPLSQAERF
jgi:hypothetical protein